MNFPILSTRGGASATVHWTAVFGCSTQLCHHSTLVFCSERFLRHFERSEKISPLFFCKLMPAGVSLRLSRLTERRRLTTFRGGRFHEFASYFAARTDRARYGRGANSRPTHRGREERG